MSRPNAAFRSAELLNSESVVLSAKEQSQRGQERGVVRGSAGKQGHGGMKFHVIRRPENLRDRALRRLIHQVRALAQPGSQQRMLDISSRLREPGDAVLMSHGAAAQAPQLGKNEPHPMRSLAAGAQFLPHSLKHRRLSVDK